ncbi:MAG TPA: AMP-binding protein [Vicinamibacteria bacterium]|nr:AMP-binding protein [Vicinamibacteria bacterium]
MPIFGPLLDECIIHDRGVMGEAEWRSFVEDVRHGARYPFSEHWRRFRNFHADRPSSKGPPVAWWPDESTVARSNLASFMNEVSLPSYSALHRFSVESREAFWDRVITRLGIVFTERPRSVLDLSRGVEDPLWLQGARLNIVASCFSASPEAAAIVFAHEDGGAVETMSYHELERQTLRFANGLQGLGHVPNDRVALYMPMTPECVIAYLGLVRSGCAVVSIADSFSAGELAKRMEIAGARTVVTVSSYGRAGRRIELYPKVREALGSLGGGRAIVIGEARLEAGDVAWSDVLDSSDRPVIEITEPEHVTNVLFSSGTTGDPKAIPWTQLTPLKCALDGHFHQDIHPRDVVCWPTNIGWMMGPWLIYSSLLNRATIALFEGAPAGESFTRFVREAGVTMLGVVPAIVRNWRQSESVGEGDFAGVRVFSSTGEASTAEDALWLMSRAEYRAPVIEYLGGTEIGGGHITGTVLHPASPGTFSAKAIGTEFYVLDDRGHEASEGETGELFLVPPSLGLSQRLLNRDHHDVYYRACPVGPNGETLRRHGDEMAVLAKGYFRAQGRADDTMNLGGIKVSSLELERVVNEHPAVHESAAVGVQPRGGGAEKLVVFVVPAALGHTGDELQKALGRSIAAKLNPLFKIHEVVEVESLPRTASNKVMRRELRSRYQGRARSG